MSSDQQYSVDIPERPGCDQCWPQSASTAWERSRSLKHKHSLVRESHYHVTIAACPFCSQHFVRIFTETIDWLGGNDPQYSTVYPLSPEEADYLGQLGEDVTEQILNGLPSERMSLIHDFPRAGGVQTHWSQGIFIGPHD